MAGRKKGFGFPKPFFKRAVACLLDRRTDGRELGVQVVPRPFTAAMIASEMPAAIRPYSIAGAGFVLDEASNELGHL
jgi:hypothetical protein